MPTHCRQRRQSNLDRERAINLRHVAFFIQQTRLAAHRQRCPHGGEKLRCEKDEQERQEERCLTPPAGQPVPAPAPASGGIDKMRRQFSHAERDTHQRGAQNSPQNRARYLTRLEGYRQEQAATAPPARRGRESRRASGRWFSHWPAPARHCENRGRRQQADGGRQSQLDRLRHRAGDHFAQAKAGQQEEEDPPTSRQFRGQSRQPIPSLPASVTPTSTEPPMPGPTINGRT